MKPITVLLCLAATGLLAACATAEETLSGVPTALPQASLPTAVPPSNESGVWAVSFQYEFPAGFWALGEHRYGFLMNCPELEQEGGSEWRFFQATNFAPKTDGPIYLRLAGLSLGALAPIDRDAIHPDQVTIAIITFVGVTEQQALDAAASDACEILFGWDGVGNQSLSAGKPFRP